MTGTTVTIAIGVLAQDDEIEVTGFQHRSKRWRQVEVEKEVPRRRKIRINGQLRDFDDLRT